MLSCAMKTTLPHTHCAARSGHPKDLLLACLAILSQCLLIRRSTVWCFRVGDGKKSLLIRE